MYQLLFVAFENLKEEPSSIIIILAGFKNGAKVRGPYLAELYYLSNTGKYGAELDTTKLSDAIIEYVERFGELQCCSSDLEKSISSLGTLVEPLIRSLESTLQKTINEVETFQIRRNITILNLIHSLKRLNGSEIELSQVEQLISFYDKSLVIKLADERDRHPGDGYLLLAVTLIIQKYSKDSHDKKLLYHAISILEYGLTTSKFNYLFKILMVRILFEVGCPQKAIDVALSLDIKQMQFDTLSYLYTSGIENFGCQPGVKIALQNALSIYYYNQIETPEMTIQAFKFATLSKIPEFIDFKERLDNSLQRAISARQSIRIELLIAQSWSELNQNIATMELESLSLGNLSLNRWMLSRYG